MKRAPWGTKWLRNSNVNCSFSDPKGYLEQLQEKKKKNNKLSSLNSHLKLGSGNCGDSRTVPK